MYKYIFVVFDSRIFVFNVYIRLASRCVYFMSSSLSMCFAFRSSFAFNLFLCSFFLLFSRSFFFIFVGLFMPVFAISASCYHCHRRRRRCCYLYFHLLRRCFSFVPSFFFCVFIRFFFFHFSCQKRQAIRWNRKIYNEYSYSSYQFFSYSRFLYMFRCAQCALFGNQETKSSRGDVMRQKFYEFFFFFPMYFFRLFREPAKQNGTEYIQRT